MQTLVRYGESCLPCGGEGGVVQAGAGGPRDPRLGFLWLLRIGLPGNDENSINFNPGDMLAIRSDNWSGDRLRLGIVQGWDPDKEMRPYSREDDGLYVDVIVCVHDQSAVAAAGLPCDSVELGGLGGWFVSGDLCTGTILEMRFIG